MDIINIYVILVYEVLAQDKIIAFTPVLEYWVTFF